MAVLNRRFTLVRIFTILLLLVTCVWLWAVSRHDTPVFKVKHDEWWRRLDINWTNGSDFLIFLHIQRTAGKAFLYSLGTVTQYNKLLCSLNVTKWTNGSIPKSWRLSCPISNASYYPDRYINSNHWWPTTKPLTLKEMKAMIRHRHMKPLPEMWLQSEVTYQWPCGIHSFYTAMIPCIQTFYIKRYGPRKRNYHYFTLLRHPVHRYLSEFRHIAQGNANWDVITGVKHCHNAISESTVPECYHNAYKRYPWYNVTLAKFLSCSHNWANNRYTWMLADLKLLQCNNNRSYNKTQFESNLLKSAKKRLKSMAFFGISEHLKETSILFEYRFTVKLLSLATTDKTLLSRDIDRNLYNEIVRLNYMDMALYNYAFNLFRNRLKFIGIHLNTNQ